MKDRFSIGEFSALFNLNVQTLHYYESIGLFVPSHKDELTGYRYYDFDQVYRLTTIRYLKRLGYSLKQIRSYLDTRDVETIMDQLKAQSREIERQLDDLAIIHGAIKRKIDHIESRIWQIDTQEMKLREIPSRNYLPIGAEESLYRNDLFYLFPTVVFYEQGNKSFGAMLPDTFPIEKDLHVEYPEVREIPSGTYLCAYHVGAYESVQETVDHMRMKAGDLGIRLHEGTVNLNIIDQFVERDSSRFITEIQVRVL